MLSVWRATSRGSCPPHLCNLDCESGLLHFIVQMDFIGFSIQEKVSLQRTGCVLLSVSIVVNNDLFELGRQYSTLLLLIVLLFLSLGYSAS